MRIASTYDSSDRMAALIPVIRYGTTYQKKCRLQIGWSHEARTEAGVAEEEAQAQEEVRSWPDLSNALAALSTRWDGCVSTAQLLGHL